MRKLKILKFLSLLLVSVLTASSFTLINSYETKANFIGADNFGSFFSASNNGVFKFSPEGKFLYRYEEFRYGRIGMLDVTNPLKVLVFYPDFMTIVFLDRFLSPLNTYNFFESGYQNVSVVASSTDGRIWFYDNNDFKLKKVNETGKIFLESQPLNLVLDKTPSPSYMVENNNKVYMSDTTMGILVFDIFGSYLKTIPLKGLRKFQIVQDQLVYFENQKVLSYNTLTLESKFLSVPDSGSVLQAILEKDKIAVLKKDKVEFYKY